MDARFFLSHSSAQARIFSRDARGNDGGGFVVSTGGAGGRVCGEGVAIGGGVRGDWLVAGGGRIAAGGLGAGFAATGDFASFGGVVFGGLREGDAFGIGAGEVGGSVCASARKQGATTASAIIRNVARRASRAIYYPRPPCYGAKSLYVRRQRI